jgi:hypothetical protein
MADVTGRQKQLIREIQHRRDRTLSIPNNMGWRAFVAAELADQKFINCLVTCDELHLSLPDPLIHVEHEDPECTSWMTWENCCFCMERTPMWTKLTDRSPGEQVACCSVCSALHTPDQVPTKRAWCDAVEKTIQFFEGEMSRMPNRPAVQLFSELYDASGSVSRGELKQMLDNMSSVSAVHGVSVKRKKCIKSARRSRARRGAVHTTDHGGGIGCGIKTLPHPRESKCPNKGVW